MNLFIKLFENLFVVVVFAVVFARGGDLGQVVIALPFCVAIMPELVTTPYKTIKNLITRA